MKKIKLLFAALAAVAGTSGAIASNLPSSSSADVLHNWINWDNQLVLVNATKEQAQTLCSGTFNICLRAQDNTSIYTNGDVTY
ncbi:hypothetical protein [Chitinophaga filiformis]|uniref:Uncharacterized protein n=1 Tax=Chitinophaga filiformis TaxID=104663 RepID=A0ABY4HTD6_CHIFI|nr:hypothetical protein [Chitinophaga filiformis]UPK66645.1 hypothetical protein MYF79_17035 [Chitinophaga filiformis]